MKEASILVRDAQDYTPDEIADGIKVLRGLEFLSLGCRVEFEIEVGREEGLSMDFPYPELFEGVRHRLAENPVVVATYIRSWQDSESEEQQAAWMLSFEW